ncbi:MAG: dihydrofolate reductase, partial [Aequorivita sp.]|nr:dihydrofolate reductase [Aequorivita sp.]
MKKTFFIAMAMSGLLFFSCKDNKPEKDVAQVENTTSAEFDYNVETFGDVKVLRYQIPGWDKLSLKEQKLVYYLSQAGLEGRDIMWDQNYRYNLTIRKALENVYANYKGDKTTDDWKNFEIYLKRVWFSNGIHHHYSNDKLKPEFSSEYLKQLLTDTNTALEGEAFEVIFNDMDSKKVNQAKGVDNVAESAVNFYGPN